jgi:hypothetical protein
VWLVLTELNALNDLGHFICSFFVGMRKLQGRAVRGDGSNGVQRMCCGALPAEHRHMN